ncbi:hypothetical protein Y032_0008g182 [Ancylostoma ceylanicum]|nr:hypothetical protein Y032_0008g182 [Ancylostoma ceylanicum]
MYLAFRFHNCVPINRMRSRRHTSFSLMDPALTPTCLRIALETHLLVKISSSADHRILRFVHLLQLKQSRVAMRKGWDVCAVADKGGSAKIVNELSWLLQAAPNGLSIGMSQVENTEVLLTRSTRSTFTATHPPSILSSLESLTWIGMHSHALTMFGYDTMWTEGERCGSTPPQN